MNIVLGVHVKHDRSACIIIDGTVDVIDIVTDHSTALPRLLLLYFLHHK